MRVFTFRVTHETNSDVLASANWRELFLAGIIWVPIDLRSSVLAMLSPMFEYLITPIDN